MGLGERLRNHAVVQFLKFILVAELFIPVQGCMRKAQHKSAQRAGGLGWRKGDSQPADRKQGTCHALYLVSGGSHMRTVQQAPNP